MKAIVFVDVQNDFITGALRNEAAIAKMPKIIEFAKECVAKGYKLYATRDTHKKTVIGFTETGYVNEGGIIKNERIERPVSGYLTTLEGQKLPVEHCVEGTDGWMIDSALMDVLDGKCTFVNKPTFGSFDLAEIIDEDIQSGHVLDNLPSEKRLDEMYEPLEEIVLVGFCTSICVISNALLLRAKFPNTKITILKDLCACVTEESHNAALKTAEMCQIDVK